MGCLKSLVVLRSLEEEALFQRRALSLDSSNPNLKNVGPLSECICLMHPHKLGTAPPHQQLDNKYNKVIYIYIEPL